MNINATLIGQMITFALFVWFTMKFVWPPLDKILVARQQKVSEGLSAAERGHKELEISQKYAIQHIHEARQKALEAVELAKQQAALIIEEAKAEANRERARIVSLGHAEINQERIKASATLQKEVVELVLKSAEALLGRAMTDKDQQYLLNRNVNFD